MINKMTPKIIQLLRFVLNLRINILHKRVKSVCWGDRTSSRQSAGKMQLSYMRRITERCQVDGNAVFDNLVKQLRFTF